MRSISTLDSEITQRSVAHTHNPNDQFNTIKHQINIQTFKDQILRLQVEPFPVALSPQPGDGGVEVPTAEGLHGGGGRQEVSLGPQQNIALPLCVFLPRQHAEREVVVGDVDVARVVSFVWVILAALPVPPGVRLVPAVGAYRHGYQPQRAERQKQPRHG